MDYVEFLKVMAELAEKAKVMYDDGKSVSEVADFLESRLRPYYERLEGK